MARLKRSYLIAVIFCLVTIVGFSVFGCASPTDTSSSDAVDIDTQIAASVEATVAIAVAETVTAMTTENTSTTVFGESSESGESSKIESDTNVESAAEVIDGATGESASALTDNEQQTMQYVIDNTRHYIGDPNAPVVFIEFSDFQ